MTHPSALGKELTRTPATEVGSRGSYEDYRLGSLRTLVLRWGVGSIFQCARGDWHLGVYACSPSCNTALIGQVVLLVI